MEKRLPLAIALSVFVLIAYSALMSKFAPPQQKPFETVSEQASEWEQKPVVKDRVQLIESPSEIAVTEKEDLSNSLILLNNNELQLKISELGSGIHEASVTQYSTSLPQINIGGIVGWSGNKFDEIYSTVGKTISYTDEDRKLVIQLNYRLIEDDYTMELSISFVNTSNEMRYIDPGIIIASFDEALIKKNPMDQRYVEFAMALQDQVFRKQFFALKQSKLESLRSSPSWKSPLWIGVRDRYFCSIVVPMQDIDRIEKHVDSGITSYLAYSKNMALTPGISVTQAYRIYLGPQVPSLISQFEPGCESIVHYGFFDTVSKMLLGVLRFINKFCNNWGVTLIVFSFLVFLVMSPLSIKSFSSMKKMQDLQPEIELLKAKLKDNPQKLNRELMELYKERKINPLGGCLPILLQMPIFVSLFQLLIRFVSLKGATFLWIKDLSAPDRLFTFSKSFPIIGNEFNLLPVIMIITMLVQQRITGAQHGKGASAAQQQKMMSLFMAVFFGIIFYRMPAGLVLYWSVNSLLMLIFQMRLFVNPK